MQIPPLNFNAGNLIPGMEAGQRLAESRERQKNTRLSRDIMKAQEERKQELWDANKAAVKAQRMLSVLDADSEAKAQILSSIYFPGSEVRWHTPGQQAELNGYSNIDGYGLKLQGPQVEMRMDGRIVRGPKSVLSEMQKMQVSGTAPQRVMEYGMQNGVFVDSPEMVQMKRPSTVDGLAIDMLYRLPQEEQTEENFASIMSKLSAFDSKPTKPTTLQQNLELAGLKPGTLEFQNAVLGSIAKPGMRFETTPGGGVSFVSGSGVGSGPITPTRTMQNKIQEKLFNARESSARLDNIVSGFRPEFLTIPERAGHKWTELKEKFNMGDVPGEDVARLEDFTKFRQDSLENINLYIKEITGAQMSEKEANRLRQALPDPGEGILDGDSPTEFKSKLINTIKKSKLAIARYHIMLQHGMDEESIKKAVGGDMVIPLDEVEKMMVKRFEEYKRDPRFKGRDLAAISNAVASDFGLGE